MNDLTIVYYTDNSLRSNGLRWFENRCAQELVKSAAGKRIISVSHEPMNLGDNICVGKLIRSHHSLFSQTLVGAKEATTKYIGLAEHDCFYHPGHWDWRPTDDGVFWYNVHHYFCQLSSGEYSYMRRRPMSQLICERGIFIQAIEEKILMLETGFEIRKGQPGACEPGVCDHRTAFVEARKEWVEKLQGAATAHDDERFYTHWSASEVVAEPGIADDREHYAAAKKAWWDSMKDVGKESKWQAGAFRTEIPNLDIRTGHNFSGSRRAKQRTMELPYWGRFRDYLYQ